MKKKIVSTILAGILCVSIGIGAYATDYSERIAEIEAEIEALEAELRELKIASGETLVEGMELYSGEFGVLAFKKVTEDGVVFMLENTTDEAYTVYSEYLTINGEQYNDGWDEEEEIEIGGVYVQMAPESKQEIEFMISLEKLDILELSGQFLVCEFETGYNLGLISFSK